MHGGDLERADRGQGPPITSARSGGETRLPRPPTLRGWAASLLMDVFNPMIAMRWICLVPFLSCVVGCGSGSSDPTKDPAAAPALKERADIIERHKANAAKGARPGRPVGNPQR